MSKDEEVREKYNLSADSDDTLTRESKEITMEKARKVGREKIDLRFLPFDESGLKNSNLVEIDSKEWEAPLAALVSREFTEELLDGSAGSLVKIRSVSSVKQSFNRFSNGAELKSRHLNEIDHSEVILALYEGWIEPSQITARVLTELLNSRQYRNHKCRSSKETLWTDFGLEKFDKKQAEKTPLS